MRSSLMFAAVLAAIASVATAAFASRRVISRDAAYRSPAAARCEARAVNASAVLPGTALAVAPLPGSYDALPSTQISMLGATASALSAIRVSGSRSGLHRGRLHPYSQGDGASFLPSSPFSGGESVTVRGRVRGHPFAFNFVVARQDTHLSPTVAPAHFASDENEMMHFRSRPELRPPSLLIAATSSQSAPGYIFAAPYSGPGPAGPMIFDEHGELVWFLPLSGETVAANLQVQRNGEKPVLSWWQGLVTAQGFGQGEEVIYDSSYRQVGRVRAGNGLSADLHDFHITGARTAVLTAFNPIDCNLSALGGPAGAAVTDTVIQEIDLASGLVRREWHSLDHVALSDSYQSAASAAEAWPFDYFHLNSVQQLPDGRTLISSRNTSALYELDTVSGQVLSRIGGKHSSFTLGPGTSTAYQHDATVLADGTISVFDNGALPQVHAQSRAILIGLDPDHRTDTLLAQYVHPSPLLAGSQGGVQALAGGDLFLGWGSAPYFSEFSPSGALLYDAHMHGSYQSYRAYRFTWTGAPSEPPALLATGAPGAPSTVYASWNGDTRTASWQLLAGPSPSRLSAVATVPRGGFETAITAPAAERYVEVRALDAEGAAIGSSRVAKG